MEKVELDKILYSVGGWGKFQIRTYVPLCSVVLFSVFQMSYIFVARDTKYRCKINSCENDSGVYNPPWLKNAVPFKDDVPNRCLFYKPLDNETCINFSRNTTYICHEHVFEKNQTTIVQDFNITCDENLWKLTIVGTISAIGELVCLSFIGLASDRFGRKRILVISMFFTTTLGLLRSLSPTYLFYVILEFLDTALGSGIYSGAFVIALEIVSAKRRTMANTIICTAFAIGQVLLGLAAWVSSSWRVLLRLIYTPGILILLSLWYVPESVRWLVLKNRSEKAWKILNVACKFNTGHALNEEILTSHEENQSDKDLPLVMIIKSKTLMLRIVLCAYLWVCCNFPYYGLTIQSVALSEDVYVNFISTALIEIPAYVVTHKAMDYFGRRKTLGFSLILGGFSCILVYVGANSAWLALAVFLSGKFFITIAYTTLYIYTAEMFPTNSRHSVIAACSMFGRLGSMLAPQVPLLERLFKSLPLIIFSVMGLTSGVVAFFFPETRDCDLPDEVEEAVKMDTQNP